MQRNGEQPNGKQRVLIAGGGVAALEAALALRVHAADRVAVELLAPEPHFWYRPVSVAAPFELGTVAHFELDGLARQIGASFTLGAPDWHRRVATRRIHVEEHADPVRDAPRRMWGVAVSRRPRSAHVPRPGRHRAHRAPPRGNRRRRGALGGVRHPVGRGLVAARLRARAPHGQTPPREGCEGCRPHTRHARDRTAPALRITGQRGRASAAR